ncbi:hypothetical protein JCGZ_16451 [Jatropha curcas]|uniref:Uncharacterized protein n=1 Tax=Jatropha curcas TaxID=180498 RepID=A0A067JYU2_JATCU|nr:hypothetical protein JCGZ_16451 [Jatropha curcas]
MDMDTDETILPNSGKPNNNVGLLDILSKAQFSLAQFGEWTDHFDFGRSDEQSALKLRCRYRWKLDLAGLLMLIRLLA